MRVAAKPARSPCSFLGVAGCSVPCHVQVHSFCCAYCFSYSRVLLCACPRACVFLLQRRCSTRFLAATFFWSALCFVLWYGMWRHKTPQCAQGHTKVSTAVGLNVAVVRWVCGCIPGSPLRTAKHIILICGGRTSSNTTLPHHRGACREESTGDAILP